MLFDSFTVFINVKDLNKKLLGSTPNVEFSAEKSETECDIIYHTKQDFAKGQRLVGEEIR